MNRITFKSRRKYSEVTQKAVEENLPEFTDCLLLTVYRKLVHFLPVNSYTSETASYLGNGPASYKNNSELQYCTSLFKKQVKQHRLLFWPTNELQHSLQWLGLNALTSPERWRKRTRSCKGALQQASICYLYHRQTGMSRKKTQVSFGQREKCICFPLWIIMHTQVFEPQLINTEEGTARLPP